MSVEANLAEFACAVSSNRHGAEPAKTPCELLGEAAAETRRLVLPAMRAALVEMDQQVGLVCAYHEGWVDLEGNLCEGDSGKLLRPTMALATAKGVGGTAADAVRATKRIAHDTQRLIEEAGGRERARRAVANCAREVTEAFDH